jgi:hypothetical protein
MATNAAEPAITLAGDPQTIAFTPTILTLRLSARAIAALGRARTSRITITATSTTPKRTLRTTSRPITLRRSGQTHPQVEAAPRG